jgi:hypothetical protein
VLNQIEEQIRRDVEFKTHRASWVRIVVAQILLFTILFNVGPTEVLAQGKGVTNSSYDEVVTRFGLLPVVSLPSGIVPLQFSSPQELESFLENAQATTENSTHTIYKERNAITKSSITPLATSYGVFTRSCSVPIAYGIATFNTWGILGSQLMNHSGGLIPYCAHILC